MEKIVMSMISNELEIIKKGMLNHAIKRGKFLLRSGAYSTLYIDSKILTLDPFYLDIISRLLLEKIAEIDKVDAIGGISIGSIPISTMMTYHCLKKRRIQSFVFRKKVKQYGLKNPIEGTLPKPPANIVIVDDSTSTGSSNLKVANYLVQQGFNIVSILSVFDRGRGGKEYLNQHGFSFDYLLSIADFPEFDVME